MFDVSSETTNLYGQNDIFPAVSREVDPSDSMANGDRGHYFSVGASALTSIRLALDTLRVEHANVHRVLDYACGYGRVLRWLRAAFPEAYIKGVDADRASAEAASALVGNGEAAQLDIRLTESLGDSFDLIWVGSLFTHLNAIETTRVLRYLRSHLSPTGVLVFTTHGLDVFQRVKSGERTYELEPDGIEILLDGFDKTGYGYADYPLQSGYGISVTRPIVINRLAVDSGLFPFFFRPHHWDNHQDVFACTLY